jgi:GTP-binding protein HflX
MEKALLVHLSTNKKERQSSAESMFELRGLVESAGAEVLDEVYQYRPQISPRFFIGEGKADEIGLMLQEQEADLVVFDHILTPIQLRSLEDRLKSKVIDRTQIILDIFAQRAHSREGKLQVELAQLNYLLPRLTGKGIALSRLGGGIGTRGPGEKKLEEDRRRIQERITHIKGLLRKIQSRRSQQRKGRKKGPIPLVSLVGYTNAGKSSLFNQLAQEQRLASSQLFATLDPVIRRVSFPDGSYCFLSDTVGFIKNLPVELKTAFRATLEELNEADCICHVIDITSAQCMSQVEAVERILTELGAVHVPHLKIHNKIDLLPEKDILLQKNQVPGNSSVYISARTGEGLPELKKKLQEIVFKDLELYTLKIPKSDKIEIHSFPKWSIVLKRRENKYDHELKLLAEPKTVIKYAAYIQGGEETW